MGSMEVFVADSSSLILLAKCGLLEKVTEKKKVVIGEAVQEEVLRGEYPDVKIVRNLINKKKIRVARVKNMALHEIRLSSGEREAVALALEKKAVLLCDDGKALRIAKGFGLAYRTTPGIVLDLYKDRTIDYVKTQKSFEMLRLIGWYSPDVIGYFLSELVRSKGGH